MGTISRNFDVQDFQCHCQSCAENPGRPVTVQRMVDVVQSLRDRMAKPLVVACGVRCEAHNKAVGGAPHSRHLPQYRDAVDLAYATPEEGYEILSQVAVTHGIGCIEVCKAHIHIDLRPLTYPILLVSLGE